ncbi:MAG: DUF805 domain-containing protein [Sphingomonas sp.]
MKWMFLPLKRYADFDGRSRRLEYWMFQLFLVIVFAIVVAFTIAMARPGEGLSDGLYDGTTSAGDPNPLIGLPIVLGGIFWLGILVPSIAVTVRRLHDRDMSGWFYLISFVPYVGGLIIFVFMCLPGTPGENQYGDDPLDETESPDQLDQIFG